MADDCEELRTVVAQWLSGCGFAVTQAGTGAEAIRELKNHYFDVIITDVLMPDADGLEVMREVRQRYPSSRILAMTGGGPGMNAEHCLQLAESMGAHAMLAKPFTPAALENVVRGLLASAGDS